jgi:DEAD/DEAH box helicase domain-containing protein
MLFEEILDEIVREKGDANRMTHVEVIPARKASYTDLPPGLHPELAEALERLGVDKLYPHQAQALDLVSKGNHVMISTGTASGKSLCYHLPVYQELLENPSSRAMYIFPTKALAQDQLRSLKALQGGKVKSATYDGDTQADLRSWIRREAQVVLTNPDMLHYGILPNHRLWGKFFSHLRYVVLDEAHVARGVFGSHVAQVMRRLRRICSLYGSRPQFLFTSATIANPSQHASRLAGVEVKAVEDDSPCGTRRTSSAWRGARFIAPATWRRRSCSRGSCGSESALSPSRVRARRPS